MIAELVDGKYATVAKLLAQPNCGEFCDQCGDCLHCYGDDDCPGQFLHTWIVYAEQHEKWRRNHPEAVPA